MDWPNFKGRLTVGSHAQMYDFGKMVDARPCAYLRAADVEDVVIAVRHAASEGLPIVARGQGHTTRGQSISDGGLIIDLRHIGHLGSYRKKTLEVGAGARWSSIVDHTFDEGLTPLVLTDYLELTVGGTLSVGGVGGQSFRHGLQVDTVVELDVVTGAGERVRCSADENVDLFDACRGGLGHFGIIVGARIRLGPAPKAVRVRHLPFPDLDSFLSGQLQLARAGVFEYLVGNLGPPAGPEADPKDWALSVECVEYLDGRPPAGRRIDLQSVGMTRTVPSGEELPFLSYVNRLRAMVEAWQRSGSWQARHPWIDLFLPGRSAKDLVSFGLRGLDASGLGEGYVMTYPLLAGCSSAPLPGVPSDDSFLFDILPTVGLKDTARREALERRNERLFEAASVRGATVYPIGYPLGTPAMDDAAWSRQLGRHRDALARTRNQHDPAGVCNPNIGMFSMSSSTPA